MAAMQPRPPQMGMQPPQPSPGHAPGHPHGAMPQQMAGQLPQGQPQNPAMKIPFPLLPHIHLKSHHLYPVSRNQDIPTIVQYLKDAPRIINQLQPVEWSYLDAPRDGTVMLVWQAPGQVQFASDGFWWCDVETQRSMQTGNYNLEIYSQRVGYVPGEKIATHSRTRYRLTPNGPPNQAPCDPCLWIVRWYRANASQHIPVDRIPQNTPMAGIMHQRAQIESAGKLVRKPFMLTDMPSWPALQVPEPLLRQHRGSNAMEDLHAAKRQRNEDGGDEDAVLETIEVNPPPGEDDDKDIYDLLTPRDISIHRYTRHNEWMEELFASPYALSNIKPASLGLGRGGALRKLTKAFYQPALDEQLIRQPEKYTGDDIARPYTTEEVSSLEEAVNSYLSKTQSETAALTQRHEAALSQLRDKSLFMDSEARLRNAVLDPTMSDPLDVESGSHFHYTPSRKRPEKLEDILAEVSAKLDGQIPQSAPAFKCVSQGGYQTPPPPPSPPAEEEDEEDEEMADDDDGGQFVDFAATEDNGGLSSQPHPDAAKGARHAPGTIAAAGPAAQGMNADASDAAKLAATNPAAGDQASAAGTSGEATAAGGATADPTEDMLDFDAGDGSAGDEDGDFGASLDFGDLPEGEGEDEDEDEDDGGEAGAELAGLGGLDGVDDAADTVGDGEAPDVALGDASSAGADAAAAVQAVDEAAPPPAGPGNTLAAAAAAAETIPAQSATATTGDNVAETAATVTDGDATMGDAAMEAVAGSGSEKGAENGQGSDGGQGSGDNDLEGVGDGTGDGMDFDDSAFGDAFHNSDFEA